MMPIDRKTRANCPNTTEPSKLLARIRPSKKQINDALRDLGVPITVRGKGGMEWQKNTLYRLPASRTEAYTVWTSFIQYTFDTKAGYLCNVTLRAGHTTVEDDNLGVYASRYNKEVVDLCVTTGTDNDEGVKKRLINTIVGAVCYTYDENVKARLMNNCQ